MLTRFVLPRDVALIQARDLDEDVRALLGCGDGDVALSRPLARSSAKVIDARTAVLLRQFVTPATMAEGIVGASRELMVDARAIVDDAFAALETMVNSGYLVSPDSPLAAEIVALLRRGDEFEGFRIQYCAHVMEDVELHAVIDEAGRPHALKLWRTDDSTARNAAAHEASVLAHLSQAPVPRLIFDGSLAQQPYVVMEWCRGSSVERVAAERRTSHDAQSRCQLLALLTSVADAYSEVHARGVLHGDVHDGNILIDRNGEVRLIDFGNARFFGATTETAEMMRGVYLPYAEPELAESELSGRPPPAATAPSEQYALGAMLFNLATGSGYVSLASARDTAMRQIAVEPPRTFVAAGVAPWPDLERVLERTLQKNPAARYESIAELARVLRAVTVPEDADAEPGLPNAPNTARHGPFAELWAQLGPGGSVFEEGLHEPPTCSIAYGAAGIAHALYRKAVIHGAPQWLSLAAHWAWVAMKNRRTTSAFFDGGEMNPDSTPLGSAHHGLTGVHLVRFLCSHAQGDRSAMRMTQRPLLRWAAARNPQHDLTLGKAGGLWALAVSLETLGNGYWRIGRRIRAAGDDIYSVLNVYLSQRAAVGEDVDLANLGIAHGWGGILYAMMRWGMARGRPVAEAQIVRLQQLARCAETHGRGLRWPWRDSADGEESYIGGWCNGSAGFVHLWLLAHQLAAADNGDYVDLARGAAWHAWEHEDWEQPSLCCGLAGRAYALLALYRATQEREWLRRARELAYSAAELVSLDEPNAYSLYRGVVGVALLLEELEQPHLARMPLFEPEGW